MSKTSLGDLSRSLTDRQTDRQTDTGADRKDSQQFCGDIDMRIARDGTWFYHGSPIGRKPMVKLFAGVLGRDAAGDYWLETSVEKCRIQVEDAPFTAVEMTVAGSARDQSLRFRTNLDEWVVAGADHPLRFHVDSGTGEPAPYILVREGLEALMVRAVYYDLVELGVENSSGSNHDFGVWSSGVFFPLAKIEELDG